MRMSNCFLLQVFFSVDVFDSVIVEACELIWMKLL